jgi:diaminopimelate decarboxylase
VNIDYARNLDGYPAYVYDLAGLEGHVSAIRGTLRGTELFYAAKANPDTEVLRTLAPHVDGIEVSSGGELAHVRETLPDMPVAFGGPGKTTEELSLARTLNVDRIHVESPSELTRLAALGPAGILLRANLPLKAPNAALTMSGPFGMDEDTLNECARLRVEPGRSMTAYHGWYVTDVLDVKTTRNQTYIVLRGGTHHLRTPVTKGHNQPFTALTTKGPERPATLVGQLCTPKDVFARDVLVPPLAPGDIIAFAMAGAYAWNISHHDFLMHPKPAFHDLR